MKDTLTIAPGMTADRKRNITQVITDYSKRLMGFIRKRVNNEADAEDILQDVFYQFVGNTQPIEQMTAWLFTVARNKIIDRQRKKKPEALEDLFGEEENEEGGLNWSEFLFDASDNPEKDYLRTLFWEELNNALSELPEEQRQVFILNELEGVPFKEIAERTGETVNTLLSRKRYAVLHLRNRLSVLKDELLNY
ncbi:RNA polymerase subunit sigma-24 [Niastella koreensis]|uniref:RNA polymerase, sigma-24 subunit, ECF subfamily n=2 Tax=Niastella koreensis TaxID=354356 RepID=G8TK08_NIAKG|nr:RNA polymerase sigma factor [Niastella koreensis]AEW02946.1 RNA polymerase, sigma-24 subunit, ECF subfamily [Niastella koreensis GR20-10]OQP55262.1 RNA polymerase subunit sigma-24 [Niastella koreensis]